MRIIEDKLKQKEAELKKLDDAKREKDMRRQREE